MNKVRLGLIGIGNMGSFHANLLLEDKIPGMELAALCDIDSDKRAKWKEHKIPVFAEAGELLRSGEVEAVLIATPHWSHPDLGIAALQAGLHVLVEKPIAVHAADAQRLIDAHTNPRQVFAAMFNQRTDPCYIRLKHLIESGELGPIQRIQWTMTDWFRTEAYYASGGWRATWKGEGGGVLLNQCPHQLDLWQWLFGMPSRVRAVCRLGRFHDIEVEDSVTAVFEYDGGADAVFTTTTGEAPGTNRLEIAADRGRVVVEGGRIEFRQTVQPVGEFLRTCPKGFAAPDTERIVIEPAGNGPQHAGILTNFAAAIRGERELIAPAEEGIHSVTLANAMLFSSLRNETMDLPLDREAFAAALQDLIAHSTREKKPVRGGTADDFTNSF
jgi:predicted dehydrogenase